MVNPHFIFRSSLLIIVYYVIARCFRREKPFGLRIFVFGQRAGASAAAARQA
jgi:hypothetical protein